MTDSPSQDNGCIPFSVEIDSYDDTDVITFGTTIMHKVGVVKEKVKRMSLRGDNLDCHLLNDFSSIFGGQASWLSGTDCEILRVGGKGWKKGKLKFEFTVKFYPDEPDVEEVNQIEPSLDDIRLSLDKLRQ